MNEEKFDTKRCSGNTIILPLLCLTCCNIIFNDIKKSSYRDIKILANCNGCKKIKPHLPKVSYSVLFPIIAKH